MESYLEPFRTAVASIDDDFVGLRALSQGNREQQEWSALLESKWKAKLDELQETIKLRKDRGTEAAAQVVLTNHGKEIMDDIRHVVDTMEDAQRTALNCRVAQSAARVDRAIASLVISTWVALLSFMLFYFAVLYHLVSPQKNKQFLQEKLERWRVTLASIVDAVVVTDQAGHVTFLNAAAQALTERGPDEAIGQPLEVVFPIVNETTREPVENPVAKVLKQGFAVGLANHSALISRSGRIIPIDDSAAPIHDQRGNVLGVAVVSHDVTARRRADEPQRLLAAVVESSEDAIISKILDGVITSWNQTAERMVGYTAAEAEGQPVSLIVPPERQDEIADILERVRRGERVDHFETVRRRKDGKLIEIELFVSPIRDAEGRTIGASKVARDISELRSAIRQLEDSEARTRAIFDAAVDALVTIDERGTVESLNPAAERLFGYPVAELVGRNVKLLMPEPYRSEHDGYLANYRTTGQKKIIGIGREVVGRRKDGSTFPMELAVSEVQLAERRLFAGSVRDISERKRAEEQLRFYAEELQHRNTELLRSNQELDEFAYIVSHDLKEPLRGIHNYSNFLIEDYGDKLDQDGRAKLETLKDLAQRMYALIDSLLEFSRVGRVDLAIRETDLNEVLAEVLDSLRITLDEQGVQIRIPRSLPTVRCDRVRIAEVFRNLISNAIKYNNKSEKWIEIGWHSQPGTQSGEILDSSSSPPSMVTVFTVRDNGIGIQEKHFESIFRIFKRLHARDKFGGGTGVGLTIVKKIIERHDGRIWIESTYGTGTTFAFTLSGEDVHHGEG